MFHLEPSRFVDLKIALPYGVVEDDLPPPPLRSVFYVHLNEDGTKEIIVSMGPDGPRGIGIFQLKGGKWTDIGASKTAALSAPNGMDTIKSKMREAVEEGLLLADFLDLLADDIERFEMKSTSAVCYHR